jgi:hypothetical protein
VQVRLVFPLHSRVQTNEQLLLTVSVIFLLVEGLILGTPPVYTKGLNHEQAKIASSNSYYVAGMYAATTILSIFMYSYRSRQESSKLGKAARVPDVGALDTSDAFNVPLVNNNGGGAASASAEGVTRQPSGKKKKSSSNKSRSENAVTSI